MTITPYRALCLGFFIAIAAICMITYYLVYNLINELVTNLAIDQTILAHKLQLLAYQLVTLTLISSIIFAAGLRVYFYQRNPHHPQKKSSKTSTKNLTTSTITSTITTTYETATVTKKALQILVVDNDDEIISKMKGHLTHTKINPKRNTFTANNRPDAIKLFAQEAIDIIFINVDEHSLDSSQTLQQIRALETTYRTTRPTTQRQRTPVIAVSSHSRQIMQFNVLQQGFDGYLEKPINPEDLLNALQRWQPTTLNAAIKRGKKLSSSLFKTTKKDYKNTLKKVVDIQSSLKKSNHNHQLAKDMFQLLIEMIAAEKDNLHVLYKDKNWERLYQLNHKIYGGSSYCGVPKLQSANKKLEMLLQRKLDFHPPTESLEKDQTENETAYDTKDIGLAVIEIQNAIGEIVEWDTQQDTDVIFGVD